MASTLLATQATAAMQWDITEPDLDAQSFYIEHLKADLLPGTFVLLGAGANNQGGGDVVARIISGTSGSPCEVTVNMFKNLNDVTRQGILHPPVLEENHLRHFQEVVQTAELRIVNAQDIKNVCFVFTSTSLRDTSTMAFSCQGMALAFLLRFRLGDGGGTLSDVPDRCCLPFPSSYQVCMSTWLLLWRRM
jgi:hypothetical protein